MLHIRGAALRTHCLQGLTQTCGVINLSGAIRARSGLSAASHHKAEFGVSCKGSGKSILVWPNERCAMGAISCPVRILSTGSVPLNTETSPGKSYQSPDADPSKHEQTPFPSFVTGQPLSEKLRRTWVWYTAPVPAYPRWSAAWWKEMAWLCVIFSITGSAALLVVRAALGSVDISASLFHGEPQHRLLYSVLMLPSYRYALIDRNLPGTRPCDQHLGENI